jgi:hypothetical protein
MNYEKFKFNDGQVALRGIDLTFVGNEYIIPYKDCVNFLLHTKSLHDMGVRKIENKDMEAATAERIAFIAWLDMGEPKPKEKS